jgi:hypothetical protein
LIIVSRPLQEAVVKIPRAKPLRRKESLGALASLREMFIHGFLSGSRPLQEAVVKIPRAKPLRRK